LPYLRRRFDLRSIIKARILRTAGIGESQIDSRLGDLLTASNPTIGLAAHAGQTDVRITAKAHSEQEADRLIAPVEAEVRERLGEVIYGTGKETVQEVLLRGLAQAGLTLAVAEAGTGGRLTNRLATVPGAESVFRGGQVAHDPPALGKTLQIAPEGESLEHLQDFARRLAQRLTATSEPGQRLGLVVLTLPRPSGDQAQDKALRQAQDKATSASGTIIALATPVGVELLHRGFGGHAAHVAMWASTNALELTRRWLLRHRN
jgi:nicotinamide-nucleotide amidase